MKYKRIVFVLGLWISMSSCAARVAHVTNLPPGVTEQQAKDYDAAIGALHKIAIVNTTLRKTVISVRAAGLFPDDRSFGLALVSVAKIDQAELAAIDYLRDAPEYFGEAQKQRIRDIFAGITTQIQTLNAEGVTGIKNPNSLKQVNGLISELTSVINLVLSLSQ